MDETDTPEPVPETRFVGASVPVPLADALAYSASTNERSAAAELRMALRSWLSEVPGLSSKPEPESEANAA